MDMRAGAVFYQLPASINKTAILYAQKRLNINGSEIPDPEYVPVLQEYIKSITTGSNNLYKWKFENPPEWVSLLEKEYGLKSYIERGNDKR